VAPAKAASTSSRKIDTELPFEKVEPTPLSGAVVTAATVSAAFGVSVGATVGDSTPPTSDGDSGEFVGVSVATSVVGVFVGTRFDGGVFVGVFVGTMFDGGVFVGVFVGTTGVLVGVFVGVLVGGTSQASVVLRLKSSESFSFLLSTVSGNCTDSKMTWKSISNASCPCASRLNSKV
jgi:hypothetical protein